MEGNKENGKASTIPAAKGPNGTVDYAEAQSVIHFWREAGPKLWFAKNVAFDDEFRSRFLDLHFAVARREREGWIEQPEASLALVILLDQFPRNCFRDTAHMFATDALARHYARTLINAGHLEHIDEPLRLFACVPFSHSEDITDQHHAVSLYEQYARGDIKWALNHRDIIRRFGRFPHRNASLGRTTGHEEQKFMEEGGFTG